MTSPRGEQIKSTGVSRVRVSQTISIPATTNYTAEDVISDNASTGTYGTFSNVVASPGGSGTIVQAVCVVQTTNQAHRVTLLLFNAVPTSNLNDNAVNTAPAWADLAGYIGEINYPALNDRGGASKAEVIPGEGKLPKPFTCAVGSKDIYYIAITEDAFTNEAADDDYNFAILVDQN